MPKGVPTVRHMNTPTFDFDALFHNSAHPGLQALARQGQLRHYRKNTLLVQQGDMGQAILPGFVGATAGVRHVQRQQAS